MDYSEISKKIERENMNWFMTTEAPASIISGDTNCHSSSSPNGDDDVDLILAKELQQLSFQARCQIQEEIHGVQSVCPNETPEMISNALDQLEEELYQIYTSHSQHFEEYREALSHLPDNKYIQSNDFLLAFLRADLYDAKRAALRLTKYLHLIFKYYGLEGLQRPLRFRDLAPLEQELVRAGNYQILPSRDRARRLVIVHQGSMAGEGVTNFHRIRVMLYFANVILEDVDTQKLGLVVLYSAEQQAFDYLSESDCVKDFTEIVQGYPVRWGAIHCCLPDTPGMRLLRGLLALTMMGTEQRVRAKFYQGGFTLETQYDLMSYGIPIQELPVSSTGTIKTKNHLKWTQYRIAIDEARERGLDTSNRIFHPAPRDVLFSRGGNARHHGNMEFHQIMDSKVHEYNTTSNRKEKRHIRDCIIDAVQARQGRFLEMTRELFWVEIVDREVLHGKVTTALSDHGRTMKARENRQRNMSDTEKFLETHKRRKLGGPSCLCST